ncbi:MAG: site-2 protease family protein [Clostridiales bacterium]|jgi:stage IV sporulation protein FB|nr:site-2 protease family protein [Clostridiales bacterium]
MIHIRFSFIAVALLLILSGHAPELLVLFLSVTLHELAHALLARRFGARVDGLNLTALGEVAVIRRMECIGFWRRALTLLGGPLTNLLLSFCAYAVYFWGRAEIFYEIALYNFALCVFNLLPVFPLDGGRIAQLFLGNIFGVPRANRAILRFGRAAGLLLMVPGLVQAVLYPFNISLLCMGMYLWRRNRSALVQTFEFFQALLGKPAQLTAKGALPVKLLHARAAYPLRRVVDRLDWDHTTLIMLDNAGSPCEWLTESEIMRHVARNGLTGTVGEVLNFS